MRAVWLMVMMTVLHDYVVERFMKIRRVSPAPCGRGRLWPLHALPKPESRISDFAPFAPFPWQTRRPRLSMLPV
jgi:hypothetical protein